MIRAVLLSGLLGAGKTTWLTERLDRAASPGQAPSCVIVNDFADEGVDDAGLSARFAERIEVIGIAGGCICCTAAASLDAQLLALVQREHRSEMVGTVMIETSGLADPGAIVERLSKHPVLGHAVSIDEIVIAVPADRSRELLRHHALGRAQLARADRVVVTRSDLVDDDEIAAVVGELRTFAPGAQLSLAAFGVEAEAPAVAPRALDAVELLHGHATAPVAVVLEVGAEVSWQEFCLWFDAVVRAHPHGILRAKGIVRSPAGPLLLQSVDGTVPLPTPAEPPAEGVATSMTFILDGLDPERMRASFARFVPSARA